MTGERVRLDLLLVRRGLARSRGRARDLVREGRVLVAGTPAVRPSTPVPAEAVVEVVGDVPDVVGRGAHKLAAALEAFGAADAVGVGPDPSGTTPFLVHGRRCIDVGASTGGFTQVLLRAGAAHVVALDVGTGQLVAEIAGDPRVTEMSGTTVRGITAAEIGGQVEVLVADLSFISLTLVMADLAGLLTDDGQAVLLVKPQFEVGPEGLGKRGVVRSAAHRRRGLLAVLDEAERVGLHPAGLVTCPVPGGEGNTEYLLWVTRRPRPDLTWQALRSRADQLAGTVSEHPHDHRPDHRPGHRPDLRPDLRTRRTREDPADEQ